MKLSLAWVRKTLKSSPYKSIYSPVISAYIVGSEAKGTSTSESDIDIAVIIPKRKGQSSIKVTEDYHYHFPSDKSKPHFEGRRIDFQFFYETDLELNVYSKIQIR